MKEIIKDLSYLLAFVPALLGGLVDYLNQIHNGKKKWSLFGFAVHLLSAIFFGWICGSIAAGLGYGVHVISASSGIGGFLGVRVADLITWRLMGADRRRG